MMPTKENFHLQEKNNAPIVQWGFLTILCVTGAILWTWYAGKDLNWDSQNYHLYVAYQWVENRLSKDFMAASVQSYLNPVGYLPFYWMVRENFPSIVIGSLLATLHAVNLLLIAAIASSLLPRAIKWRFMWIVFSVLTAAISSVFATEVGNTFIDITTSIFVLAAYAVCFRRLVFELDTPNGMSIRSTTDLRVWMAAGIFLGIACGLKLTNVIFAVALCPLVIGTQQSVSRYAYRALCYFTGALIGFVIIDGYWAWCLFKEFGNPFFPFFNIFFKSSDFPVFNISDSRFIPESFREALFFPIHALASDQNVYTEWWSPDARFCVLFLILIGLSIKFAFKRCLNIRNRSNPCHQSVQVYAIAVWLLSYVIWLCISGNGRYFLAGLLLLGPLIVALLLNLIGTHRFTVYALSLLLALQVAFLAASQQRWSPAPWSGSWFEVYAPKKLTNTPYLYLTPTIQPAMYLAPFLHSESAFSNIAGQVTLTEQGPGGKRVSKLINQYKGNIRSLFQVSIGKGMSASSKEQVESFDGVYERFNLQTDPTSCEVINGMHYQNTESSFGLGNAWGISHPPGLLRPIAVSCRLIPHAGPMLLDSETAQRIDHVFDRIERMCPRRFNPTHTVTKKFPTAWARYYFNSVVTLLYLPERDKLEYQVLGGGTVYLGKLADWEFGDTPSFDCSIKKGYVLDQKASTMN